MENSEVINQQKKINPALVAGIFFMPVIFSWFTLKSGYSKLARYWSFGWLAFVLLMTIGSGDGSQNKVDQPKNFSFGLEGFIGSYNAALESLGSSITVYIKQSDNNDLFITSQLAATSENIAFVVNSSVEADYVESVTFIGSGDGSLQSGVDVILGMVAVVMAIENPWMPTEERASIVKDLGLNEDVEGEFSRKITRNNVDYFIQKSDSFGMVLIAEFGG